MDTSVTIIGLFITFLIGVPLYFVMKPSSINKKKIEEIKNKFSQNKHLNFEMTEIQNKKVLSLDKKNKVFLLIDFNPKEEVTTFIDLNTINSCKLLLTNDSSGTVVKIDFEFQHKKDKKTTLVPFYGIENDHLNQVRLYEDNQLGEKWIEIIQDCISS